MTDTSRKSRASLRIPFLHQGELDSPEFEEGLSAGNLALVKRRDQKDLEIIECRSRDPRLEGSVMFLRSREIADIGCVHVAGPGRVDLALSLVLALRYIPAGLLHLGARNAPDRQARLNALQVLSLVYLTEEGVSYWDTHMETTARRVRSSPDGELRRQALFAEVVSRPATALQHIRELLETERQEEEVRQLQVLLEVTQQHTQQLQDEVVPEERPEQEPRLALPFIQDAPLHEMVERFDSISTVVRNTETREDGGAHVAELAANGLDARTLLIAPEGAPVGCAYITGADAFNVAVGSGNGLPYFPVELAKQIARTSRFAEYRVQALQALALSSSPRYLPSKGIDPEVTELFQAALADPKAEVRRTAESLNLRLREAP